VNRFLAAVVMVGLVGCGGGDDVTGPSEVQIEDLVVGTGATVVLGDIVTVNYVGTLLNGTVFGNSATDGQSLTFQVGALRLIPGFEQGVLGMRVGGKRRLTIPPSLAYGSSGQGPIPPNSTIRFEVDLLAIAGK
jgi:FKBP-type peptidyl-prolyl cis-trans isomerase